MLAIRALNGKGKTILLVEQNVAVSLKNYNHAYVLENGSIVMRGKGSDLLHDDRVPRANLRAPLRAVTWRRSSRTIRRRRF